MKNIVIGGEANGFELTPTGLTVHGRPSFDVYMGAGDFIHKTVRASEFWLADWLRYGDGRRDWEDRIAQAHDATGLSPKTLKNVRAVGAMEAAVRRADVPFSIHAEVASLTSKEQKYWLDQAETNGWTQRELRLNIRAQRRTKIIEGQALLLGKYRVILADPPWLYRQSNPTSDGSLGKAAEHYPPMSYAELMLLPVAAHAHEHAILFCWVTASVLYDAPGPREVISAWGFEPKTGIVWNKVLGMPGNYTHVIHEHIIIATRGSCLPDVPTPQLMSIFTERRRGEHSEKPKGLHAEIEKRWTTGPYLELFGRERREGWDVFGNDARLFWAKGDE